MAATAEPGDIVRNITTRQIGRVRCGLQSGRIVVELPIRSPMRGTERIVAPAVTWERWGVEVICKADN